MAANDRTQDTLARQLQRCLQRIDVDLEQLLAQERDPETAATDLDTRTAELQDLLAAVTHAAAAVATAEAAAMADIVRRCVEALVHEQRVALTVQSHLAAALPPVACSPERAHSAVQRVLALAAAYAGHGGALTVTSAAQGHEVVLSVTALGSEGPGQHLRERALTLKAFVAELDGRCEIAQHGAGPLQLRLALPTAIAAGPR